MRTTVVATAVDSLMTTVREALPAGTSWRLRTLSEHAGVEVSRDRPLSGTVVAAAVTDDASSAAAVAYAQTCASRLAVPLRLIHVWSGAHREASGVWMRPDLPPHADLLIASVAYDTLDPAEAACAERQLLHDPDPAAALSAVSGEAVLLVVGATSGPVTVARPMGTTTHALIGRTACPLVVLLPPAEDVPPWWKTTTEPGAY